MPNADSRGKTAGPPAGRVPEAHRLGSHREVSNGPESAIDQAWGFARSVARSAPFPPG